MTSLTIDQTNSGTGTTTLQSSTSNAAFSAQVTGQGGTGVRGTGLVGVQGITNTTNGAAVIAQTSVSGGIALVARGTRPQTANLQEWVIFVERPRQQTLPLSVVDANGHFGIGTATPAAALDVKTDGVGILVNGVNLLSSIQALQQTVQALQQTVQALQQTVQTLQQTVQTQGGQISQLEASAFGGP